MAWKLVLCSGQMWIFHEFPYEYDKKKKRDTVKKHLMPKNWPKKNEIMRKDEKKTEGRKNGR